MRTRLNSTLLTQRILIDFNIVTETCLAILANKSFFSGFFLYFGSFLLFLVAGLVFSSYTSLQ